MTPEQRIHMERDERRGMTIGKMIAEFVCFGALVFLIVVVFPLMAGG